MRGCELFRCSLIPLLAALVFRVAGGCVRENPPRFDHQAPAPPPSPTADELRGRAHRTFGRAIFYKPREESLVGIEGTFAPLIVQELVSAETGPSGFGAIAGEAGKERIDLTHPTVYVDVSRTYVGSTELQQLTYFWRYPTTCGARGCASHSGSGVRITLGLDGLPVLWEGLSTSEERTVLFVADSLEEAARREFGEPLEGRTYSIERAMSETKRVVVVRLLDDGPVAMGPYVYVGPPSNAQVTTVLCRCMPSQVDEFSESRYYELVPMESLSVTVLPFARCGNELQFLPDPKIRWSGGLSSTALRDPSFSKHLDQLLRWPKEYR